MTASSTSYASKMLLSGRLTIIVIFVALGLPSGLNAASASVSARLNINEPTGMEPGGSAELSANVIVLTKYNGLFDVDNSAGKLMIILKL